MSAVAWSQTPAPIPTGPITVGYYQAWADPSSTAQATLGSLYTSGALAHLNYLIYAFSNVSSVTTNGVTTSACSLDSTVSADAISRPYSATESVDGVADPQNNSTHLHGDFNQLLKIKNLLKLQGHNLKILISVGGATYSTNFVGANPATLANSCEKTFIEGQFSNVQPSGTKPAQVYPGIFDGVDVDCEYPDSSSTTSNFVTLIQDLRSDMNSYSKGVSTYTLTAAIGTENSAANY